MGPRDKPEGDDRSWWQRWCDWRRRFVTPIRSCHGTTAVGMVRRPFSLRRRLSKLAAGVEFLPDDVLRHLAIARLRQFVPEEHPARLLVAGELVLEEGKPPTRRG